MFFSVDTSLILFGGAVLILLLLLWNARLEWKLRRLCRGKNVGSLESLIGDLGKGQEDLNRFKQELEEYLKKVEKRLRSAVRGIGVVRFNAFRGMGEGGNQSFAAAFLNEEGDGVVVSSLYARDRVSVFAKPIEKNASAFELTEEEREALKKAKEIEQVRR